MSKKIAVIYKTKYGSTKKYAGWIALKLEADLYEVSDIRPKHLLEYDIIIFGGGLYIGKINGINFIKNNYDKIKDRQLLIFTVGMQTINDDIRDKIIDMNFKNMELENVNIFNYMGAFEYRQLSIIDKMLITPIKKQIYYKNVRDLTIEDENLLKGFKNLVDLSNKKSINSLIEEVCATN
ncbi:MAG: flavodoxin domain-containing protein [Paraclostridium sp.]